MIDIEKLLKLKRSAEPVHNVTSEMIEEDKKKYKAIIKKIMKKEANQKKQ